MFLYLIFKILVINSLKSLSIHPNNRRLIIFLVHDLFPLVVPVDEVQIVAAAGGNWLILTEGGFLTRVWPFILLRLLLVEVSFLFFVLGFWIIY